MNLLHGAQSPSHFSIAERGISAIVSRLDALMMVLKDCKGVDCTRPWPVLHPDGDITTLEGALRSQFDTFYLQQPKMVFDSCELGFIPEAESREHVNPYTEGGRLRKQTFDYVDDWVFFI